MPSHIAATNLSKIIFSKINVNNSAEWAGLFLHQGHSNQVIRTSQSYLVSE